MTQTSAFHLAAESTQPQLHMLTLQALNMIPPASFAVPATSPQGIATTILSMVLKLVYKNDRAKGSGCYWYYSGNTDEKYL